MSFAQALGSSDHALRISRWFDRAFGLGYSARPLGNHGVLDGRAPHANPIARGSSMCLLVFSLRADNSLVWVANRDEAYDRPTAALDFWPDRPEILAGRDLRAGGTWFGVSRGGRVAAITNFRQGPRRALSSSRGEIVSDFLQSAASPLDFMHGLAARAGRYAGFSLVAGQHGRFVYFSNMGGPPRELPPGSYGLSNSFLDTAWPKLVRSKARLAAALAAGTSDAASLSELLLDRSVPGDAELPDTGVGLELERMLAPSFIVSADYGTRSSTALVIDASGHVDMHEKSYGRGGVLLGQAARRFTLAT